MRGVSVSLDNKQENKLKKNPINLNIIDINCLFFQHKPQDSLQTLLTALIVLTTVVCKTKGQQVKD